MPVIDRPILPNFQQYVKCVDEKTVKNPVTKSFEMVKCTCRDNLCGCCKLVTVECIGAIQINLSICVLTAFGTVAA